MAPVKATQRCVHCREPFYGLIRDHCTVACRHRAKQATAAASKGQPVYCHGCGERLADGTRRKYCTDQCRRSREQRKKGVIRSRGGNHAN